MQVEDGGSDQVKRNAFGVTAVPISDVNAMGPADVALPCADNTTCAQCHVPCLVLIGARLSLEQEFVIDGHDGGVTTCTTQLSITLYDSKDINGDDGGGAPLRGAPSDYGLWAALGASRHVLAFYSAFGCSTG
ncbi:hypothetical protein CYMTET_22933 [Cymbomonas tetramitiformis]|uniref:Uncharacterized protein n=1 Tax=Cymbomonas tetramitiformis TaxID=36881 RepID=A0AAE0FZE1_9CHLO|nr:hypothetical protein CYMTET_22933 [Cymbomonas tetramitiformis]